MDSITDRIYSFLKSIKLAAFLLVLIGIFAIIGGIIPQGKSLEFYLSHYPKFAKTIQGLGFDHIFTSLPFLALVALFTVNLTVCTVHRFGTEMAKPREKRKHGPDLLHIGLIVIIFGSILSARTRTEEMFYLAKGQHLHLPDKMVLQIMALSEEKYDTGRVRSWTTEAILRQPSPEPAHTDEQFSGGDTLGEEGFADQKLSGTFPAMPAMPAAPSSPNAATSQTPDETETTVSVPEGEKVTIKVNAPLRRKGYTVYQFNWKKSQVPVLAGKDGIIRELEPGNRILTPEGFILFMAFEEAPAPQGAPVSPKAVFLVDSAGKRDLVKAQPGDSIQGYTFQGYGEHPISGLKVISDRWFPLILAGLVLALFGTALTYIKKLKGLNI